MKRWFMMGVAMAAALQLGACTPADNDMIEEEIDTGVEQVQATVDTKVEQVQATVEPIVVTTGEEVAGLTDWGTELVDALALLGAQEELLQTDPTLMADDGWRSDTEVVLVQLEDLTDQAMAASDELKTDDEISTLATALAAVATDLSTLTTETRVALEADDAEMFGAATSELDGLTTAVGATQMLIDTLQ